MVYQFCNSKFLQSSLHFLFNAIHSGRFAKGQRDKATQMNWTQGFRLSLDLNLFVFNSLQMKVLTKIHTEISKCQQAIPFLTAVEKQSKEIQFREKWGCTQWGEAKGSSSKAVWTALHGTQATTVLWYIAHLCDSGEEWHFLDFNFWFAFEN